MTQSSLFPIIGYTLPRLHNFHGGGSAVSYAWWIWQKGYAGSTTLDWINHPKPSLNPNVTQLQLF